jgi:hypothetical protein
VVKISISSPAVVIAAHMHRNPVKRGSVVSLEQWRWSSLFSNVVDVVAVKASNLLVPEKIANAVRPRH